MLMEDYSIFCILGKIGTFVQYCFSEMVVFSLNFDSVLVDRMEYPSTVRWGRSFEKFHIVDTETLVYPVLCWEPIYSLEFRDPKMCCVF